MPLTFVPMTEDELTAERVAMLATPLAWADYASCDDPPTADTFEFGCDGDYSDLGIASHKVKAAAAVLKRSILTRLAHRDVKAGLRVRVSVVIEDLP